MAAENFFHFLEDSSVWGASLEVCFFKKIFFNFIIIVGIIIGIIRKNRQGNKSGMPFLICLSVVCSLAICIYHYLLIKLITNIKINHEIKWKCKDSLWHVKHKLFWFLVISQGLTGENGAEKQGKSHEEISDFPVNSVHLLELI